MSLFPDGLLDRLIFERGLSDDACDSKLALIRRLRLRIADGTLHSLTETRVEQSFNECLFADIFEYRSLFRDGAGDYHIQPKVFRNGRYDDFSIGFYGPTRNIALVTAELKGPGTNLDAAVRQAFGVLSPTIQWVIASNFDEIRLYHRDDSRAHERLLLSDIVSRQDVRRAFALFGRPNLLGMVDTDAPLLILKRNRGPVLLDTREGQIRLIHEARVACTRDASWHRMDDGLRAALEFVRKRNWNWPVVFPNTFPEQVRDRLVVEVTSPSALQWRMELTRNGTLRLQEYFGAVGDRGETNGRWMVNYPIFNVAQHMALFAGISESIFRSAFGAFSASYSWTLLDATHLDLSVTPDWWGKGREAVGCSFQSSTETCIGECDALLETTGLERPNFVGWLRTAVRELLFPFVRRPPNQSMIMRIAPSDEAIAGVLPNDWPS